MVNLINLNSFLKFGYFLDYKNPNIKLDFSGIDKEKYKDTSEKELIDIGIKLWKEAVQKQFNPNEKHVVPLSGGLDSRVILATLLEFTEAKNIFTYTFGTPRTLDYDIGNFIANKMGTNHTKFPLTEYQYSNEEEIDISKRSDHQAILFHHAPIWEIDKLYKNKIIWSGFLGDTIGGSHSIIFKNCKLVESKTNFLYRNIFVKSMELSNIIDKKYLDLIEYNNLNINIEETINLINGEIKSVAPYLLVDGFDYKLPHIDKDYLGFMLSLDNKYRDKQDLYKKILIKLNKNLFKIKSKDRYLSIPQKISRKVINFLNINKNSQINYLDFNNKIKHKKDLYDVINNNIMDLKKRKIVDWIDIDSIWQRHISKKANHADALLVLASLEIHLKAGKQI